MSIDLEKIKEIYWAKINDDKLNFEKRLDGLALEKKKINQSLATLETDCKRDLYKGYLAELARGANGLDTMLNYSDFKDLLNKKGVANAKRIRTDTTNNNK